MARVHIHNPIPGSLRMLVSIAVVLFLAFDGIQLLYYHLNNSDAANFTARQVVLDHSDRLAENIVADHAASAAASKGLRLITYVNNSDGSVTVTVQAHAPNLVIGRVFHKLVDYTLTGTADPLR